MWGRNLPNRPVDVEWPALVNQIIGVRTTGYDDNGAYQETPLHWGTLLFVVHDRAERAFVLHFRGGHQITVRENCDVQISTKMATR